MLRALAAPYGSFGIRLCATVGINATNMAYYLALPIVASDGGTRVRASSPLYGQAIGRFFSTLPPAASTT